MKVRLILWIIPLVLFLAFAAFLMTRLGKDPAELPSVRIGKPFPTFTATTLLDGKTVTVEDLKGKAALNDNNCVQLPLRCFAGSCRIFRLQMAGPTLGRPFVPRAPRTFRHCSKNG